MKRLPWIDISKGLAILFVVYFHFFRTVFEHYQLPAADWSGLVASTMSILRAGWWQISGLGFHAVGAFIILSGWTLMQSTMARAESGRVAWGKWYGARFVRLYPMYWVAHLVYLVSPFVARLEPVDERIILSLLGLRFINIEMNFMYLNAAWWYFAMLIQFYLIFPLLFWAARKFGALIFLLIACALGFFVRYLMLDVYPVHGLWTLGGFAICRLPEFALGMALGMWHAQSTRLREVPVRLGPTARQASRVEWFLLRGPGLIAGIALYPLALKLYDNGIAYVFCDFGTGACCFLAIVGIAGLISHLGRLAKILGVVGMYSYGLYLIHQPYVIWLGLKIRPQPIMIFILIFVIAAAVLSAWGIVLEKTTNALVTKLLPARKPSPA
ncbi:MAG TPA: acyltransferase [Chthoniobacterales bacterium]|nr:acyltransferase [Chthoniobacterales bacterium]